MRLNPIPLIVLSGLLWFVVGFFLLTLGLNFIVHAAERSSADPSSLIQWLKPIAGSREQAALLLIVLGLMAGFLKGRFVLSKTVARVVKRILSLPAPIKLSQVYGVGYLALIGGMVLLGISLKWFHMPEEIRGAIDVAVGSALINGALAYFRQALAARKRTS